MYSFFLLISSFPIHTHTASTFLMQGLGRHKSHLRKQNIVRQLRVILCYMSCLGLLIQRTGNCFKSRNLDVSQSEERRELDRGTNSARPPLRILLMTSLCLAYEIVNRKDITSYHSTQISKVFKFDFVFLMWIHPH
jgi:hypothetical protein